MARACSLVFYSWQSDLPNATNRGFILQALENAAKAIRSDESLQVEPVIDRDTAGVAGSPDISKTIFDKIDQAHIFVCDISIINQEAATRPTPNPNVLLELGYAFKTLGDKRVVMVFNDAYGGPEVLPFDLRMRRVIRYHMPKEAETRATERKELEKVLREALTTILSELDVPLPGEPIQPLPLAEQARVAVETARPNQAALIRQYMMETANTIATVTPTFASNEPDRWDEQLLQAIQESIGIVLEFARLAETIAQVNAIEAARVMYKGFANILNLYTSPSDFRGMYRDSDYDLAKFLGHELFVIFFAFLIQEERWELIANLLDEDLYARSQEFSPPSTVPFHRISTYIRLLDHRNDRLKLRRLSLHFDLLNERHTQGDLAKLMPMEQFAEADFFLFLKAELQETSSSQWISWIPWSVLGMRHPPRYLQEAARIKYAQQLLRPLGVEDISTLRTRLQERAGKLAELWRNGFWHYPMVGFDYSTIGSR
jgi:hypothetical protein